MIPKLIHPVLIEVVFFDKENAYYDSILKEHIGKPTYTKPTVVLGQRGFPKDQAELNMVAGGDSKMADGYFLTYQSEWREKLALQEGEEFNLDIFKSAKIVKHENYQVDYKIIEAIPCTTYNHRTYFIKLEYTTPQKGM